MMDLPYQKGKQAIKRYSDYLEGWTVQKAVSRRVTTRKMLLMKYLTFKASSIQLKDLIRKSNMMWQDPKEALTSLKSWWTIKRLLFHLCYFQRLIKKTTSSLSSLKPVDQRGTRLKICKFQQIYFEAYIKLEVEEEWVRPFEYFCTYKAFIVQPSQPPELLESYLL